MLFPDSDESQHIWLQRIQLHAYSLACRSQQGTKSCWILSGAAVFTPCRERERCQYPPEDGSHNLQEGSQQHLADSADTSLYVTHLEIIYRFRPHALQTWGGVSRKMLRKKEPTGKACTCNSLNVWNVLAGRGGLQLLALSQSSFFKKHWFESSWPKWPPESKVCHCADSWCSVWTSNTPGWHCKWKVCQRTQICSLWLSANVGKLYLKKMLVH